MANEWQAKSGCHLGMINVNKLRLNVIKLENYSPTGELLCINHLTSQKLYFFFSK
jgi:hypothetical protein